MDKGGGEGDSSRTHGLPDGHHDHELHGLRPLLNKNPLAVAGGFLYECKKMSAILLHIRKKA